MPVVCCWCNASGRCRNCACKKAGRECLNCLPCRRGHCENSKQMNEHTTTPSMDSKTAESTEERSTHHPAISGNAMDQNTTTSIPKTQEITPSETLSILEQNIESLPSFTPVSDPEFRWGEVEDGRQFACALNRAYSKVVRWKTNILKVPSGKAGKMFVRELARMFNAYAEGLRVCP